ncbi:thiaminase/transcriptional activator TenA [Dysgonomonas sp. PFB1-18]|uniref:thiaminase II n=1 Tax=unclassified Dysgonomonas TaxID=2630389 RepID=UPI002474BD4B|nr:MULTISPECIES: thiaminase II [unclassified Dysgonomonas]MDH6307517.1 thiaminase/transcriptional activator TenA [Dysgonomonas sp. PF1-14]MDH6337435.1 thiaminase/transcriptional activator TenA [Dysgonomonas sp. PF1-16]MDH6379359.1 thiaminase/transcriptional activator TenA [Dysgonomonas sp. PFB1-18]MDH6396003.1 thiaminase/transcriptional activator TenA [Dysgonomonas sp. PF1-23]
MKWSEEAWQAAKPVYDKIIEQPFINGLINGTLAEEKFIFYIRQDALYLAEYGKVLTAIASRLNKPEHIEAFIHFAGDSMAVEKALHESFVSKISSSAKQEASPSCLLYTSYLLRQVATSPVEVMLAAVLPCFWIYKEVGDYILKHQIKGNNPYQSWIDTYGGEEFEQSVKTAIAICDELAEKCTPEQRQAMMDAYVMCSKMEWLFWDSAWRLEKWAV